VFGRLVVQGAGEKMLKDALKRTSQIEKDVEKLSDSSAMTYVLESREQYKVKRFAEALSSADRALEIDPANIRAMNAKARALKQLNRLPEAFAVINEALTWKRGTDTQSSENYGVLLYNKACYGLLLQTLSEHEILATLRDSFTLAPRIRDSAGTDPDLGPLHQNEEFKRLIAK
jgi:tetratricopeptide (TPR) repeat protein